MSPFVPRAAIESNLGPGGSQCIPSVTAAAYSSNQRASTVGGSIHCWELTQDGVSCPCLEEPQAENGLTDHRRGSEVLQAQGWCKMQTSLEEWNCFISCFALTSLRAVTLLALTSCRPGWEEENENGDVRKDRFWEGGALCELWWHWCRDLDGRVFALYS